MEKYVRAGQAAEDSIVHALCLLDNQVYKYTHTICNTCCFPTSNSSYMNSIQRYTVRTLPVLNEAFCGIY